MFRITPYRNSLRTQNTARDVFDLFDDFFTERHQSVNQFRLDVRDTKEAYIIDADMPGLTKEDIRIHFEDEQLVIGIDKEEEKEESTDDYIHKERACINAERRLHLKDVDPSKFKASLNNGVLTITAPKLEEKVNTYMIDIE